VSYMIKSKLVACAKCGKQTDVTNVVEMFPVRSGGFGSSDPIPLPTEDWCYPCFYSRGAKPEAKAPKAPAPRHPWADYAVSEHKTLQAAQERARKVAYALGRQAEIQPSDPAHPGPFYVLDAAIVEGFRPARNLR
jgi:hypothetical protein